MLIVGCGYVGLRVARDILGSDPERSAWGPIRHVTALTRSERRAGELRQLGCRPVVGDITKAESLADLRLDDDGTLLFAVGFDRHCGLPIEDVYCDGLGNVLNQLASCGEPLRRLIYLSSTGVYGDHGGEWVDETTAVSPEREGGRACAGAEAMLAEHPWSRAAHVILRLAGIYGPGRVPRLANLRAGTPLPTPADSWLNLIHVDDVVNVVRAVCTQPHGSRVFCVSDGHPARRRDYYRTLATVAGAPPPKFVGVADPTSLATTSRNAGDKRVSNRLLLDELRLTLRYPDCEAGLRAIVAADVAADDARSSG
ncbi:MAG: NAD-binding protein [Planctomycetales bacterium]|nr:NAD-binding protein [Planctomycetales bacterium]